MAIRDLSKAGELGELNAYNIIKSTRKNSYWQKQQFKTKKISIKLIKAEKETLISIYNDKNDK